MSRLKFGWCLDGHHENCPGTIKSANDGKVMTCTCPHHEQVRKDLEELI